MSTTNYLKRSLHKTISKKTATKKNEQIRQKYVMRHLYPKIVEGKILPKKI